MQLSITLIGDALAAIDAYRQANGCLPDHVIAVGKQGGPFVVCPRDRWNDDVLLIHGPVVDAGGVEHYVGTVPRPRK
jgi:hypothetical protein